MAAQQRPAVIMEEVTNSRRACQSTGTARTVRSQLGVVSGPRSEIYSQHRGKCICIAGEELFTADTPRGHCVGYCNPSRG